MGDEQKPAATAAAAKQAAPDENLTPWEAEILADVLAAHPTLTRDEALAELRAAGM